MNELSLRISNNGVGKESKQSHTNKLLALKFPEHYCQKYRNVVNINNLLEANSVREQLDFLRNISNSLLTNDGPGSTNLLYISLLVDIFLYSPMKHPLKNTTARILSSKKEHSGAIEKILSSEIASYISQASKSKDLSEINNVNTILNSCFDNFAPGQIAIKSLCNIILIFSNKSLKLYIGAIRDQFSQLSPTEKLQLYTCIHNLCRIMLSILQKCNANFDSLEFVEIWNDFSTSLTYLIKHHDLPMDSGILCSMIYLIIANIRFGSDVWKYIIEIISDVGNHADHVIHDEVKDIKYPIEVLCIYSALLNINPVNLNFIDGEPLLVFLTKKLFELSERMSVNGTIIIGIARAMLTISQCLFDDFLDSDVGESVINIILPFIWSHLEYYVDSVRHLSTQILTNIVKVSALMNKKYNSKISDEVFSSVMSLPADRHSKYKGLSVLASEYGCSFLLTKYPNIVGDMLSAINGASTPANVSNAFECLISQHNKEVSTDILFSTWIKPIIANMIEEKNETSEVIKDILSRAIELNNGLMELSYCFIRSTIGDGLIEGKDVKNNQIMCFLFCLHLQKYLGIEKLPRQDYDEISKMLTIYKYHESLEVRLMSLKCLVDSKKTTEIFQPFEFETLSSFYRFNINVQSPSMRQNILALSKKMLRRWKSSFDVIEKNINNLSKQITDENQSIMTRQIDLKDSYIKFIRGLWCDLLDNIFPEANYSRRHMSLQMLNWCQEIINTKDVEFEWKLDQVTSLINFLGDSYECNKQLVVDLLRYCPVNLLKFDDSVNMDNFLHEAIAKASSIKPTDCVTSAYMLSLLLYFPEQYENEFHNLSANLTSIPFKLHYYTIDLLVTKLLAEMKIAEDNILSAASNGPMYGLLHCIRHVLSSVDCKLISTNTEWSSLLYTLVQLSFRVSDIVAPVVNNSSPEGHLPMDFNAGCAHVEGNGVILENGKRVTAQMVLLCAWRSVKEVSLLLGDVSYNFEIIDGSADDRCLSAKLILDIGDHFTTLLSETKHRGAFEQAYIGFSKLCSRLWKSTNESLHNLPKTWLRDLIAAISGDSHNSKLCSTRRSAGVPFMVQALVTTELQVSGKPQSFQECLATLLELTKFNVEDGKKSSVETRTHCLNILRALYRHTALGEHVNPYVAEGLMTAISGFDGATWAERNSSTLLFSSLMTRVFGVQRSKDSETLCIRNKMTGRIFFLRYPQLYDFILDHLKHNAENIDSKDFLKPSLYPILLLLARLYPSSLEGTDSNLKLIAFVPYLLTCARSSIMKTRELAAKAMVPLVTHDRYFEYISMLFGILSDDNIQMNHCHGILLQLIKLLERLPVNYDISQKLDEHLEKVKWMYLNLWKEKPCFIVAESYVCVAYLSFIRNLTNAETLNFINFDKCLKIYLNHQQLFGIHFGKEKFFVTCLHLSLELLFKRDNLEQIAYILNTCMMSPIYEVQMSAMDYILCVQNPFDRKKISEQFEICEIVQKFVERLSMDEMNIILNQLANFNDHDLKIEHFTKIHSVESNCYKKWLMVCATSFPHIHKALWLKFTDSSLTDEERICYFMKQTHHEVNQQLNTFIFAKLLCNYFKYNSTFYNEYSHSTVMFMNRHIYESWADFNNSIMGLEAVRILKHHRQKLQPQLLLRKERVYSTILEWASILQLLDSEDECVRNAATRMILELYFPKVDNRVCESLAKVRFIEALSKVSTTVSIEMSLYVLIMLAFMENPSWSASRTIEEELQVFEKEISPLGEPIMIVKICARNMMQNLKTISWSLMTDKEKSEYILNIIESCSSNMWICEGHTCGSIHNEFCQLWKFLRLVTSDEPSDIGINTLSNDVFFNKIQVFLKELNIDYSYLFCNRTLRAVSNLIDLENYSEHIYEYMTVKAYEFKS